MLYSYIQITNISDRRRGVPGQGAKWAVLDQNGGGTEKPSPESHKSIGHLVRYQVYKCKVPVINKSRLKTLTSW